MRRQRCRIHDPGVGRDFLEAVEEGVAQFLPPEVAQVAVPEQREEQLLLEDWFGRRGQADALLARSREEFLRHGHVRQVEQLEEAIDRVAIRHAVEP